MTHDQLAIIWFLLIAVLWCGYFVLEGFDFGVGILLPFIGKNEAERRTIVSSLGPVWDGNEVWLLTAGGATFAAFSLWYATLFSGFYLALLLILVALIIRGVAFEFRSKRGVAASPNWRRNWDWAIFFGSFLPALLWGVAFANIVAGVPLELQNGNSEFTGNLFTLLNPYALLGGRPGSSLRFSPSSSACGPSCRTATTPRRASCSSCSWWWPGSARSPRTGWDVRAGRSWPRH
jgi:cytochrome d ubiquinol oxidase subunit II